MERSFEGVEEDLVELTEQLTLAAMMFMAGLSVGVAAALLGAMLSETRGKGDK